MKGRSDTVIRYLKKFVLIVLTLMADALRLPSQIHSVLKVVAHQLKGSTSFLRYGAGFCKSIIMFCFSDPIIYLIWAGILLWTYLEELLAGTDALN
jgi:hypothetical protein